MSERVVFLKIAVVFLVVVVGWVTRRRGHLPGESIGAISRFVVDVAFPSLVFVQMLRTVDAAALRQGWFLPLLCAAVLLLGWVVGLAAAPLFARGEQRRTFTFLVAFTNYVYLPLPIAEGLYGDAGVQAILLCNVGGQLIFWSLGPWILQGKLSPRQLGRQLALNPGLLATAAGVAVALLAPGARGWESVSPGEAPPLAFAAGAVVQALAMLGSLTVPLSLLVIGARLAELAAKAGRPSRALAGVLVARLVLTPALTLVLVWLLGQAGWPLPEVARMSTYLISAMAVGFTCMMFAERFGGDVHLSAQSIFYSTFFSLLTAPALFTVVRFLGL